MRRLLAAVVGAGMLPGTVWAQASKTPVDSKPAGGMARVTFQYERAGLTVPRFRMVVNEDGSGSYEADEIPSAESSGGAQGQGPGAVAHVERALTISPGMTAKIFKVARAERFFQATCASKAKHIADTGTKTLSYEGPDGKGSCVYNYTEDKGVSSMTDVFLGISQTLEEGRRLEFKRRYDRLGLDAELDALTKENDSERAVELGTISSTLRQLAGDADLMQRVRWRASKLLERAGEGR